MGNDIEHRRLLLSRRVVAELAGVSVKTVTRWEERGWLTPTLPGGKPRYARSDVERLLGSVIEIPMPSGSGTDLVELARQLGAVCELASKLAAESARRLAELAESARKLAESAESAPEEDPVEILRPELKVKKQRGET